MRILTLTALATLILDQASKLAVVFGLNLYDRGVIDVFPPYLTFRMAWNKGVNFGLFSQDSDLARWILVAVSLTISAWVVYWLNREQINARTAVSGGLLVGGAIGNVIDRVAHKAVADFLNMSCCGIENPYAFNVADIAIFAGAIGLILFSGGNATPGKATKTP